MNQPAWMHLIHRKLTPIADRLLEGVAPSCCALCRMRCTGPQALCDACMADLPRNQPACPRCALPQPATGWPCGNCQRRPPRLAQAIAPYRYEMPVAELIGGLKFGRDTSLAPVLAHLMAPTLSQRLQQDLRPDFLVPAPLHWWRQLRRRFNQSQLLAESLARHPLLRAYKLKVHSDLVRKSRHTKPQAGLKAGDRRRNLADAFQCQKLPGDIRVAIVDDVLTTGATADALAATLIEAGAASVELWACARTVQPDTRNLYSPAP